MFVVRSRAVGSELRCYQKCSAALSLPSQDAGKPFGETTTIPFSFKGCATVSVNKSCMWSLKGWGGEEPPPAFLTYRACDSHKDVTAIKLVPFSKCMILEFLVCPEWGHHCPHIFITPRNKHAHYGVTLLPLPLQH